jgi:dTDP-4-amino-4,6-dideoxygalactose transaminase
VDIDPLTFNIAAERIRDAVNSRTRAIIPVHLYGLPADMQPMLAVAREYGLTVIEDAAQAIGASYRGARAGVLGDLGCFSFFPSKNLGGAGDGGMVTTNDAMLADRLRILRVHGSRHKYYYETVGTNSRLDALQAAILRVKLRHLDDWSRMRQQKAEEYRRLFAEYELADSIALPATPSGREHVYNQFVIRCHERDRLQAYLRESGIATEVYYPQPLHLQEAFAYLGHAAGEFPSAEAASREVLALPIYPELGREQQIEVVQGIAAFYRGAKRGKC